VRLLDVELTHKVELLQVIELHTDAVPVRLFREPYRVLQVVNQDSPVFKLGVRHEVKEKTPMLPVEEFS
jgi:hypothetical protein